jgi:acyl-CoA synthetase (AMP-forming)/AMP-acid ligase II
MLTHRVILRMTMNFYADISPFSPADVLLHAAPLSHGSGLYSPSAIGKGVTNVILESKSFSAELVFEAIERYRITYMTGVPAMYTMIFRLSVIGHSAFQAVAGHGASASARIAAAPCSGF